MPHLCPICHHESFAFYKDQFLQCPSCRAIWKPSHLFLSKSEEKKRYEQHHNNAQDPRYQEFVLPLTQSIERDFPKSARGLDFGSGKSSSVGFVLREAWYDLVEYDLYFNHFPELLQTCYDFIACCEVIEHFQNPLREFWLLFGLLKNGGKLYCMTHIYNESIDFANWYYKNDPTHVCIYQKETLEYIQKVFWCKSLKITGRCIELSI